MQIAKKLVMARQDKHTHIPRRNHKKSTNLPPFSLIRDFSNQNACGNVSKISVNHTDDIPYIAVHFVPASKSLIVKCMKI